MKKLSKRLLTIANMVDDGADIADIGSDHCSLPIHLFKTKRIGYAFAVENKKGPYNRMKKAIDDSSFPIVASLSNGLDELPPNVDTIILAGMGGNLIIDILEKGKNKIQNVETIIVDAHNDRPKLTKYLSENGFSLTASEFISDDEKYYDVMKWERSDVNSSYDELEIKYGPLSIKRKPEEWKKYLRKQINAISVSIENIDEKNERRKELERERREMEELLK